MRTHYERNADAYANASKTHAISDASGYAMADASPEPRAQSPDDRGRATDLSVVSPSPNRTQHKVWLELRSGLDGLSLNDHGRPWPYPNRSAIARLTAEFDPDLCLKAACEAKEIVQSQDRAPNISALFEKKLRDLAQVRSEARESFASAGGGE